MPRVNPGVNISVTDLSQFVFQTPNSSIYGCVVESPKGFIKPTLLTSVADFKTYFGEYEDQDQTNTYALKTYISAIQLLQNATGVYVCNAVNYDGVNPDVNYAGSYMYGGQIVPIGTEIGFVYNDCGAGPFTISGLSTPVIPGSVKIKYIKTTEFITTDDGLGNIVLDTYVSAGTINYSTGVITGLTFSSAPDTLTNGITITYLYSGSSLGPTDNDASAISFTDSAVNDLYTTTVDSSPWVSGETTVSLALPYTGTKDLLPYSIVVKYVKNNTIYYEVDDGLNHITSNNNHIKSITSLVNYSVSTTDTVEANIIGFSTVKLDFDSTPPDTGSIVTVYRGPLSVLYAVSPQKWSQNYGVVMTASSASDTSNNIYNLKEYKQGVTTTQISDESSTFVNGSLIVLVNTSSYPIKPGTVSIKYTESNTNSEVTATIDSNGVFTDDPIKGTLTTASCAINNITGSIYLVTSPKFADDSSIKVSYTYYPPKLMNTIAVSRVQGKYDGFGNNVFITDVMNTRSSTFVAINNEIIPGQVNPYLGGGLVYAGGAVDSGTPTDTDRVVAITKFEDTQVNIDAFVGGGYYNKSIIDEIHSMVFAKNKWCMVDTISGIGSAVKAWVEGSTGWNNAEYKNLAAYSPNVYITYNGKIVYCPASAMAAVKYANSVSNGQKFLPPAGTERGTVNVSKLERYYGTAELLDLHEAEVNTIQVIPGFGTVIFSDFTSQRTTSSTSFINCMLTLNDMKTQFQAFLPQINFKVINDLTTLQLRTLITGYMNQLALQAGTIESDYKVNITSNKTLREYNVDIVFVFQSLVQTVNVNLIYTSNELFMQIG